ncbi:MAG: SusD/RagB family nutrient-binding outer membrane lipoprotein, partial [Paludibacter sp.]|nr:SusD/RagB family nutrient-binding outer membrane lipoprotein [Paludibacter sp.]
MKKINKFYIVGISLALILFTSCSQFEDINTNPDTTTQVSASLLCTNVVLSVAAFSSEAKSYLDDNALPKYIGYANEGQMSEQYNKIGSSSFGAMTILPDIEKMLENAQGSVMEDSYKGVAKFARAYMFYRLTMEMGDIPYSETGRGDIGLFRPKYDTQRS